MSRFGLGHSGRGFGQIGNLRARSAGIRLSNAAVATTAVQGSAVGTLSVIGTTGAPTFTLVNNAGGKYQLVGANLQVGATALTAGIDTIVVSVSGVTPAIANTTLIVVAYAAATLSSPTGSASSTSTASIGASTDQGRGTLYWTVDTSSTSPSFAQVLAGQTALGAAASAAGSANVAASGAQSVAVSGLTAGQAYFAHFAQGDPVSNQSNIVTSASFTEFAVPANTVTPSIAGTATSGSTLTLTQGTWTGVPSPTLSDQWLRDGIAIPGATGLTYTLASADVGHNISALEAATNTAGTTSATSNSVGPVGAASGYTPTFELLGF